MKTNRLFLLLGICLMLGTACTKSTTSDDEQDGNWVTRSTLDGVARSFAVAFTIGDYGYIGTGLDGNNKLLNDFWRFDPATNSWTQIASMASGRHSAVAFAINGKGYVGTGTDGIGNYFKDFYQYDPTANTWTKKADFAGTARSRAVGFAIGDKGYITCGWDGTYYKDMYVYNPTTDSWASEVSLGGDKRVGAMSFVYNDEAYILGGTSSSGQAATDFWKFSPATDSWTELNKITTATDNDFDDDYTDIVRTNGVAFVIGDRGFVTTGQSVDNGSYVNKTWCYDFATDRWTRRTPYESTRASRRGAVAFTVDGRAFVGTGINTGQPFDNFDEFLPAQAYDEND